MSLSSGTRLGPYEIVSAIGAGGMGEVYRARDTTLGRDVAIKVLSETFALDADRVARFTREAKALASLNHPNIAAIYAVETTPGVVSTALVMELVEGDDLSVLIARGAMPLDDALAIARQIADALEAAHELGIVHRDLKPQNIKVRADGAVKVLDFGLARTADVGSGSGSGNLANSPTLTAQATQMGMIIGTAAYMAPEQAKGRPVDRRADIWAFGAVLFEMLTGRQAFAGDSITEILGAVVLKEPDWSTLPAATPLRLRGLLQRCLEKDPRRRQRDIGDARLELDAIAAGATLAESAAPATAAKTRRPSLPAMAAGALAIAAVGLAAGWALAPDSTGGSSVPTRFIVSGPDAKSPTAPQLTPDGRTLVFAAKNQLFRRDLGAFDARPMPGTDGAKMPLISPDGRWVAFFAGGKIKKVSLAGGDPISIADVADNIPGAAWGSDDTILFSRAWATGLSSVAVATGEVRQLTEPSRANGERGHWRPRPLPSGRIIFTILMSGAGVIDSRIGILDPKTGQHRVLFAGSDAKYLPSGHILYSHAGAWHVVPFDPVKEVTTGDPVSVLTDAVGVTPDGGNSWDATAVSGNGVLAYAPGPNFRQMQLGWADRSGRLESLGLAPHAVAEVTLSPDGRHVAVSRVESGTYELWMVDVSRRTEDRLDIKGSNSFAVWNASSDAIAFISIRKGEFDAYTARADGSGLEAVATQDFDEQIMAWTRDGRFIEKEWRHDGSTPLLLREPGANGAAKPLVVNTATDTRVALSPDLRWMTYSSTRSGDSEIYVHPIRDGGTSVRASNRGGSHPLWSMDGREFYFLRGRDVVSVSFRDDGGRAVLGSEQVMFQLPAAALLGGLSPDGRRFLVAYPSEPDPVPGIRVVLNWFDELKAKGLGK
ncbi:MAG: serine/threonine protein kinase [Acidobacteria bacterium]|nr:MAG: serine/threonine protein kinase [Acidobacteriota bacterium]